MAIKKENILGVDIGGSKIGLVVWDGKKVVKQLFIGKPTLAKLKEGIGRLGNIKKIGMGVPGIFDEKTGRIIKCPNAAWLNGLNLKNLFPKKTVKIDNDVHCFLRAEASFGAGRGYNNILAVAFGAGIGGGVMVNSKILNSPAGEFGHMIIDEGKAWEKLYQAGKNNPKAQEKINAIGVANLINAFNPEIIILGGEGAKLPSKKVISQYLLSIPKQMPKIVLAKLGRYSNAIGAILLFSNR